MVNIGGVIGIIGGDMRTYMLAKIMKNAGLNIKCLHPSSSDGFTLNEVCSSLDEIFSVCEIIVLPLPVSRDKVSIYSSVSGESLNMSDAVPNAERYGKKTIFGGLFPSEYAFALREAGHDVVDIYDDELLTYNNAIATAEAALMIAMENTEITVRGTDFAVLGYGRIASHFAFIASALGADVTVMARRDEALQDALDEGFSAFKLESLDDNQYVEKLASTLDGSAVIVNTVPHNIIDRRVIEKMNNRPLYIELASYPYGIDARAARELNFKVIYAPSLPGRYSPMSAAEYIYESILNRRKI